MTLQWTEKKLGDIANISYGYTAKANQAEIGPRFLRITDIKPHGVDWNTVPFCQIDDKKHKKHRLQNGDIVFARTGATTGKSYLIKDPPNAVCASYLIRLSIDNTTISPKLLSHFFQTNQYWKTINGQISGSAQGGFNARKLSELKIKLPPLPEQKRIIAILDEAFAGIDQAVANTEKNLANAREVFESYLNGVFTRKGAGWVDKKLSEILETQPRNGWSPPAKHHSDQGTPVVTLSSVTGFEFNLSKIKFTSAPVKPEAHYWLKNGALLITRSNTPELVGHVAVCSGLNKPIIYPDLIMKMMLDKDVADTRFIYYQLRSKKLRELIMNSARGANPTMKKINKGVVQSLPISLPNLQEQETIVERIDAIWKATQHLKSIYQKKLNALAELKQSILHKAFTGELTQFPEQELAEAC